MIDISLYCCVSLLHVLWSYRDEEIMKRITVDLEDQLHERLRKAVYVLHKSMADIVREALEAALPSGEGTEDG